MSKHPDELEGDFVKIIAHIQLSEWTVEMLSRNPPSYLRLLFERYGELAFRKHFEGLGQKTSQTTSGPPRVPDRLEGWRHKL